MSNAALLTLPSPCINPNPDPQFRAVLSMPLWFGKSPAHSLIARWKFLKYASIKYGKEDMTKSLRGLVTMRATYNENDQYDSMVPLFNKHWQLLRAAHNLSSFIPASTVPIKESRWQWNAMIATANTIAAMLKKGSTTSPPTYVDNKMFAESFMQRIRGYIGPGAGSNIQFDAKGDAEEP